MDVAIAATPKALSPVQRFRRMGLVFGIVVMLQVAHFGEHIAQLYQFRTSPDPAHGLLGIWLDVEWVHFIYNTSLGVAILMLFLGYRMYRNEWRSASRVGWSALVAALVVQVAWHVPEHAVKMYQYFVHDWNPAPGILGTTGMIGTGPLHLIYLHFIYNAVVTTFLVVSYLAYRAYRLPAIEGSRA